MGRTIIPVFNTGDSFSGAQSVTYWRDNEIAHWTPLSAVGMQLIETFTAVGGETDYTFSAIPQTFRHLRLIISGRTIRIGFDAPVVLAVVNGDAGANYCEIITIASHNVFNQQYNGNQMGLRLGYIQCSISAANYPNVIDALVPNYTNATFYKVSQSAGSIINSADLNGCRTFILHGMWNNIAPITSLKIWMNNVVYSFAANSKISLYGLK